MSPAPMPVPRPADPTAAALAAAQALVAVLEAQQAQPPLAPPFETGWLKAHQVAAILNLSHRTVYRLIQRGELPCVRVGTAVRVDEADLRAWMDHQKQPLPRISLLRARRG